MRVLIPCGGTRGDTQPCVALAVALRKRGHTVQFFAPTTHVKLCTDQGFECMEIALDIEKYTEEILSGSDTKNFGAGFGFLMKSMKVMKNPELQEVAKSYLPKFYELAQSFKPDVIISARPLALLGICEKLRIPLILVTYQLVSPTDQSPPFIINDGLPLKWFPSWHKWIGQKLWPLGLAKTLDTFKSDDFHKEVLNCGDELKQINTLFGKMYEWGPQLLALEPEVVKFPTDYGPNVCCTGWWFLDEATDNFRASEELMTFLNDTSKPPIVYIGFGSMKGNESMSIDLSRMSIQALKQAEVRGILVGGWSGLSREKLGGMPGDDELKEWAKQNVMELKAVPHKWLFPKVAAVCHHGGAGTTAAGLRAGKPTVIVPFVADQPYFAAQVEQAGSGRKAPHVSKVSAEALAPLFKDAVTNKEMLAKAEATGKTINNRDWEGVCMAKIEQFMKTYPYPWKVDCQEQGAAAEKQRRKDWPLNTKQEVCCMCCPGGSVPGYEPSLYTTK